MAPKPLDVEIRSRGVDGVRRDLKLVGEGAEELSEKGGRAARGIAGAFVEIAHSGEVGVRSMKDFAKEGAELVTFFGTGGPVLGAIALIGIAFFESFSRGRKEMEKTRQAALEELQKIAEGGDLIAAGKAAQRLYSGDPYALIAGKKEGESDEAFYARAFGKTGLENTIELNKREIERLKAASTPEGENQIIRLTQANERLNKVLDDQNGLHARAMVLVDELAKRWGEITNNQLQNGPAPPGVPQQGLAEGSYRFGINTGMFGLLPGLTGEKDHGGNYVNPFKIKAADLPRDIFAEAQGEILKQWTASMQQMQGVMVSGIAGTLSDALADAFTGSFAQLGQDAEAGLGGIISSMGGILVQWGTMMLPLASLFSTNPLTAGLEAITIGVLLEGLGKALGKAAHGGGSSGGYAPYSGGAAYASQQSVAGRGNTTVVFKGRKQVFDMANPDDRAELTGNIRTLLGDRNIDFLFEEM